MATIGSVRIESPASFCGKPVFQVAIGSDEARGETRGHARGIIAVGDVATGWVSRSAELPAAMQR